MSIVLGPLTYNRADLIACNLTCGNRHDARMLTKRRRHYGRERSNLERCRLLRRGEIAAADQNVGDGAYQRHIDKVVVSYLTHLRWPPYHSCAEMQDGTDAHTHHVSAE